MKKIILILLSLTVLVVGTIPLDFTAKKAMAVNDITVRGILSQTEADQYGVKSFASDAQEKTMRSLDMGIKSGDRKTMGTAENPFLVLELVPWQGFAEMGYMIEGCEPIDIYSRAGCYNKEKAAYYRSIGEASHYNTYMGTTGGLSWVSYGAVVKECFADENYPGKGLSEDDPDYLYRWFKRTNANGKSIKGYYEKVAGTTIKGNHNITGVDDKGRPVFGKAEDGQGDFIWVSLGNEAPNYDFHAQKENKAAFAIDTSLGAINGAYAAGDREYTIRTEDEYWYMPSVYEIDEDGKVYSNLIPKSMFVHYNDFLRYSLRIKTKEEVDNYSIIVKPVEPRQLRDNPQYVDFADLIWIHGSSESGIASNVGVPYDYERFMNDLPTGATKDSTFFDDNNDIGWEVAEKLYFKANGLTKYAYNGDGSIKNTLMDYSGNGQYAYAPVIMAKSLVDELKDGVVHNDMTYYINYSDMTLNKSFSGGNKGRENNFYKFCLMNCMMDQDVFYDFFYTPLASTHQPVIQTIDGKGCNTVQEGDAQTFWCPEAFLPYVDGVTNQAGWGTDAGKAVLDQYKMHYYGGGFMNFPEEAILSYTYIYNVDNIFVLTSNDSFDSDNPFSSGIHAWFEVNQGKKASLSPLDVMYFLLNYQKVRKPLDTKPNPSSAPTQTPAATQQPVTTQQPSVSKQENTKKPTKVVGISVNTKKKKIRVSWEQKSGAAGYQLQYALNKKFSKKKKTINVRSCNATIQGLKKSKTYYIRVRAYKKSSGKKIYGKWSKIKKIKIK